MKITLKFHNEESRDAFIRAERLDVAGTTPSGQPILVVGEKWELRIPANERPCVAMTVAERPMTAADQKAIELLVGQCA